MQFIRVINWERYQHYKDRNPTWIKLYQDFITSETWVTGDDASRTLAIVCMVLAAKTDNKIPANPAYFRRVAYLNADPDFSPLLATHFIEVVDENGIASNSLAGCYQHASPEREREKREKNSRASRSDREGLNGAFTAFWDAYPRKKSKGQAEKAWLKIKPDEQLSTAIVSAVERAKTSADWQRDGGQFIPYPATWLNAKGWEDADASSPAIRTDL